MSKEDYKHYYRFTYLKSEHWQNLRLSKLVQGNQKCNICSCVDSSNDVHHIVYRKLHDVKLDDLVILCRKCHEKVHLVLAEMPFIKTGKDARVIWKRTVKRIVHGPYKITDESMVGYRAAINAKRRYHEAEYMAKKKFPKCRKRIKDACISFFKQNPHASTEEWINFGKSMINKSWLVLN